MYLGRIALENRPLSRMPNPWLTNPDRTNSANDFSLRQMSIAYHQSLSILIPPILVKLDVVDYLVFNRRL
jgi:hypothetical protein